MTAYTNILYEKWLIFNHVIALPRDGPPAFAALQIASIPFRFHKMLQRFIKWYETRNDDIL